MIADYRQIVSHYESCLARFGDSHRGVDWPNPVDAQTRYRVMMEVMRSSDRLPVKMLDFGCGAAHLLDYLGSRGRHDIEYIGLDISSCFVELAQNKYPDVQFFCADVLQDHVRLPDVDYVIMNGVFTEKRSLTFDEMFDYFRQVLKRVFAVTQHGMAFNVMSKHVDWEREDLFHVPFDLLASFLRAEISRNFLFRADYGLYEYTTYVYR
jgi:SAM-dependent methyltransferase